MTVFRRIKENEVPQIMDMVYERMEWMEPRNIRNWLDYGYDQLFPLSYYEDCCRNGSLYVLVDEDAGRVLAAAVLLTHDTRWGDEAGAVTEAYYLHNFVSRVDANHAGSQLLAQAEQYAVQHGARYFRLDSEVASPVLEQYYTDRGYVAVGTCVEGEYHGILRQKEL